jgi:hypothetical protein
LVGIFVLVGAGVLVGAFTLALEADVGVDKMTVAVGARGVKVSTASDVTFAAGRVWVGGGRVIAPGWVGAGAAADGNGKLQELATSSISRETRQVFFIMIIFSSLQRNQI